MCPDNNSGAISFFANSLFSAFCGTGRRGDFEIKMMMVAAARIKGCMAVGAGGVGLDISGDGKFGAAGSTKDGLRVPFRLRPGNQGMVCQGVVAILAGVVGGAAFHFDGDDVDGGVVVEAAGLGVEVQAVDFLEWGCHKRGQGRE
jgi:hypothetical protein